MLSAPIGSNIPSNFQRAYLEIEQGDRTQSWDKVESSSWQKLDCWFNPKDYTISKSNTWTEKPVTGQEVPVLQYGGGGPSSLSVDLLFDAGESEQPDVLDVSEQLMGLMTVGDPSGGDKNNKRPPAVRFHWGPVIFLGVTARLTLQFTLFEPDGRPTRAQVKLELTQIVRTTGSGGTGSLRQNPTTTGIAGLRTHVVRDGDSLHSIAYAAFGDATAWRAIAAANGIDDPLRLPRGATLAIPRRSA
jgi:Contractile injection system tube protein/LysM domain